MPPIAAAATSLPVSNCVIPIVVRPTVTVEIVPGSAEASAIKFLAKH
jgi:hypothetical protein